MFSTRRFFSLIVTAALGATIVLSGCSTKKPEPAPAPANPPSTQPVPAPAPSPTDPVKSGAGQMRGILADIKLALGAKDAARAKELAPQLEDTWAKFEDEVKARDKDRYEQVEEPLGAIQAGVKVSPLDAKTLSGQVQKLDAVLAELAK